MKKDNQNDSNELRAEYRRSDFGKLIRGQFAAQLSEETNVVVLEPDVAEAFPNDKAVNEVLRGLLHSHNAAGH